MRKKACSGNNYARMTRYGILRDRSEHLGSTAELERKPSLTISPSSIIIHHLSAISLYIICVYLDILWCSNNNVRFIGRLSYMVSVSYEVYCQCYCSPLRFVGIAET